MSLFALACILPVLPFVFARAARLICQNGAIDDRHFEIEFLDPGVNAYAFTFG